MINIIDQEGRQNEPHELRQLTKSQIFKNLSLDYFLPQKESRAVSRTYLSRVHQNQVYRIERVALLQFEAILQEDELARAANQNVTILIERADSLLRQLGQRELGFLPGTYPDEGWLYRIIRFIDPSNLLCIFRRAVRNTVPPAIIASRV